MTGNTFTASSIESSPSYRPPMDTPVTSGDHNGESTECETSKELDLLHDNAFWVLSFVLFLCAGSTLLAISSIILAVLLFASIGINICLLAIACCNKHKHTCPQPSPVEVCDASYLFSFVD